MTVRFSASLAALALVTAGPIMGQDIERVLPDAEIGESPTVELPSGMPGGGDPSASNVLLIEQLNGIDLDADATIPKRHRLDRELAPFLGRPLTIGDLETVIDRIVAHFEEAGFSAVEVLVPEQEVTDGRIAIGIVAGRAGEVALSGGKHLGRERLARSIGIVSGDVLRTPELQEELDWLNRNPFRHASLLVAPGGQLAEADLLFQFSDARPWRFFGGLENSGVEVVGEERWIAGFEWGNVAGLGHHFAYQATLGTDPDAFRAHAGVYRIPLPWRHELELRGAHVLSEVDHDDETSSGGTSWLLGAQYTVPLPRIGNVRHDLGVAFDFKYTDNNLEFGGAEVFASASEIAQWSLRYRASRADRGGTTALVAEVVTSPGNLASRNTDEAFREINPEADSAYTYLRGSLRRVRRLPGKASLVATVGGQWSAAALLPSEQLALGGYDRVRGYPEREGLGDTGYHGSLEMRAPPFAILPNTDDSLQLLAFADYGRAWAAERDRSEGDLEFSSAGPGLRYQLADHASLRLDYAWRLDGSGDSRVHFGLNVEF